MNYIYCITNVINNKRYVGKTTLSITERFKEHCIDSLKESNERRPLYDAMRKYGIENFIVEELELVEDEELLSLKEIYWIHTLETYGKTGYNATKGGDGSILYDYLEFVDLRNLGYSSAKIAEKTGATVQTINRILKSKGIKPIRSDSKKIGQFDLEGNYIQCFFGSLNAALWCVDTELTKSKHSASNHITNCCNNKEPQSMGYKWAYME